MTSVHPDEGGDDSPKAARNPADRSWQLRHAAWLLVPIMGFGLFTWVGFAYIGVKARRRAWCLSAILYGVLAAVLVYFVNTTEQSDANGNDWVGAAIVALWAVGVVHALVVNESWLRWRAHHYTPWYTNRTQAPIEEPPASQAQKQKQPVPPRFAVRTTALAALLASYAATVSILALLVYVRQEAHFHSALKTGVSCSAALSRELAEGARGGTPVPPQLLSAHGSFREGLKEVRGHISFIAEGYAATDIVSRLANAKNRWWTFRTTGRVLQPRPPDWASSTAPSEIAQRLRQAQRAAQAGDPDPSGDGQDAKNAADELVAELRAGRVRQARWVDFWTNPAAGTSLVALTFAGLAWGTRRRRRQANSALPTVAITAKYSGRGPRLQHPLARRWLAALGYGLMSVGSVSLAIGSGAGGRTGGQSGVPWWLPFPLVGVGLLLLCPGYLLWRRYHYGRVATPDLLALDGRPPVLYLRSFDDDTDAAHVDDVAEIPSRGLVALMDREEVLVTILDGIGPVIAIGRPGDVLPSVGATRLYLPDEDWRSVVASLLGEAGLVVIRLGVGEGLWWELGEALDKLKPHQLLLLLPGPPHLANVTRRLTESHHISFPQEMESGRHRLSDWTAYVVSFSPGWRAEVEPDPSAVKQPILANNPPNALAVSVKRARRRVGAKVPLGMLRLSYRRTALVRRGVLIPFAGVPIVFLFLSLIAAWVHST